MHKTLAETLDTSRFRIVDSHAHLGHYFKFHIPFGFEYDLVKQMDEVGVESMAFSPMIGLNIDCQRANNMTAEVLKKYPNRFYGMSTINPNRQGDIIPELERCFDQLNMTLIKLHPDEAGCPMSRNSYDLVLGFAAERSLPIMNHDWQSPSRLEALAKQYPNVKFTQAHSGGNWDGHSTCDYFQLARDYENIFVDICASPIYYNSLEKLVDVAGADNILFGTDAPFLNLAFGVSKVLFANISDIDKQKIFADNFLKIINSHS